MLENKFIQNITGKSLFKKKDKLLVAVSGGVDSMVLLHLLFVSGFDITVAHVNFGLRKTDADLDEKCVKDFCAKQRIPFYAKKFETKSIAKKEGLSIQQVARNLRYQCFEELCKVYGLNKIITAHHADDSIETFFINLFRGSGVMGLSGIPEQNNTIVRPLLFASKNEIVEYAKKNKINYREDKSNDTDDYLRNKIRHHLMSVMNTLFNDKKQGVLNSLTYLKVDGNSLKQRVKEIEERVIDNKKNEVRIDYSQILKHPDYHNLLFHLLQPYNYNLQTVTSLIVLLEKRNTSGKQFFSETHGLLIDRRTLIIKRIEGDSLNSTPIIISKKPQIYSNEKFKIRTKSKLLSKVSYLNAPLNQAFFDESKLNFPITLRGWEKGDKFIPLGMKGFKKVSDFLIDKKVNRFEKQSVFVLADAHNQIIWLANYRADDRFKVTDTTTKVFCMSIE